MNYAITNFFSFEFNQGTEEKLNPRGRLNDRQREFYERNGFIVIPQ